MHDGVYVDHTGPLTSRQSWWAAVLRCAPAALAGHCALDAHGVRGHRRPDDPVLVCVAAGRYLAPIPGIEVLRIVEFEARCQTNLSPPRMRIEDALLLEATRRSRPDAALAVLADTVQQRRTTPVRLVTTLRSRPRTRHHRLLTTILEDVASGAYSVLEQRYLSQVERPHGLPVGSRQRRVKVGHTVAYRDVDYVEHATTIELDGRVGHESPVELWADLDRDLMTAASGGITLRAGWGQVLEPCRLAAYVGAVLQARGWDGRVRRCREECSLPVTG